MSEPTPAAFAPALNIECSATVTHPDGTTDRDDDQHDEGTEG